MKYCCKKGTMLHKLNQRLQALKLINLTETEKIKQNSNLIFWIMNPKTDSDDFGHRF